MVDGLMRLMEGDDTGPINIGNPGKARNIPPLHKTKPNPTNLLNLLLCVWIFVFSGEFTMVELAETVKEVRVWFLDWYE